MPELPEVQTIVNDLQIITGDTITGFWTNFNKAIKSQDFEKKISGQKIKSIKRIGKNIVIEISDKNFLVLHLKMTGKLILNTKSNNSNLVIPDLPCPSSGGIRNPEPIRTLDSRLRGNDTPGILKAKSYKLEASYKHLHHVFNLKKNGALEFHDIRKFATLEIVSEEKLDLIRKEKGIDPLSKEFAFSKFKEIANTKPNKNIKSFLMDQTLISGIGNIYASEIPFETKISPLRKLNSLETNELKALYKAITKILEKAVRLRGTSFSDYRDAKGLRGSFQDHLKVYKKAGKSCAKCGTIIEKSVVEQRSTFHCPTCQK